MMRYYLSVQGDLEDVALTQFLCAGDELIMSPYG